MELKRLLSVHYPEVKSLAIMQFVKPYQAGGVPEGCLAALTNLLDTDIKPAYTTTTNWLKEKYPPIHPSTPGGEAISRPVDTAAKKTSTYEPPTKRYKLDTTTTTSTSTTTNTPTRTTLPLEGSRRNDAQHNQRPDFRRSENSKPLSGPTIHHPRTPAPQEPRSRPQTLPVTVSTFAHLR